MVGGVWFTTSARARARLGLVYTSPSRVSKYNHIHFFFSLFSLMSVANRPGYHSIDLSAPEGKRPLEGKGSLDVTDDLDRAASLSYTSHMPLNKNNPVQSTTSLPAQHSASIDNLSQPQVDREGLPPQVYYDSHPQSQHTPSTRNSSWDMLGGARKIGQAYEQFDPRNASEQHLAFADGDLPNSKVSFFRLQ